MMRRRYPSRKSKYYVEPPLYDLAVGYVRMHPVWSRELAGDPDDDRRELLQKRVEIIENAACLTVSDVMRPYVMRYVRGEASIDDLIAQGMPCGRDYLIKLKQQFLQEIAEKIR